MKPFQVMIVPQHLAVILQQMIDFVIVNLVINLGIFDHFIRAHSLLYFPYFPNFLINQSNQSNQSVKSANLHSILLVAILSLLHHRLVVY
jgi:hypothetical protein